MIATRISHKFNDNAIGIYGHYMLNENKIYTYNRQLYYP